MPAIPSEPSWVREVPVDAADCEGVPYPDTPHTAELPPDLLAEMMDGPDYSASEVISSTPQSFLDPMWWSLGEAAEFLEQNTPNDDPESSPLFTGLALVEQKIRSGTLIAYGSIDTAPTTKIAVEAWTEFEMIPCNITPNEDGSISYDVLVRSARSYRAGALQDHSHPSGAVVPSAYAKTGEPGFHRIISNTFVKESDVLTSVPKAAKKAGRQKGTGKKQKRLIATLPKIMVRGRKVFPNQPDSVSCMEITRRVIKAYEEEDLKLGSKIVQYSELAEKRSIERLYAKAKLGRDK